MYMNLCITKATIFLAVLCIVNINCIYSERQCNKNSYKEVDRMIARGLPFGNRDSKFPETLEELQNRCENRKELLKAIEDLNNRCMKGMLKRVVSVIIYSMKRQRKSLCRKKPTKQMLDLISAGKCINADRDGIEKCAKQSIDHILGIKYAENKMKIPLVCCEYVRVKECLIESASKVDVCTEENIKYLVRNSENVANGALNLACGEYTEETDKCDNIKFPPKRKGQKTPKSIIIPMIEVFESFSEE